jgi:hypothetical protein
MRLLERRTQRLRRSKQHVGYIAPGRDKDIATRQGSQMTDIGFKAIFADKYDRESAPNESEFLDV